ncbi:hypothetical protein [Methylocystis parvus]|jgi:hypothetical protein
MPADAATKAACANIITATNNIAAARGFPLCRQNGSTAAAFGSI